ncbi:MAG TPA: hypothetical protein VF597_03550 [Candidatus Saccharimonadales bacterium]
MDINYGKLSVRQLTPRTVADINRLLPRGSTPLTIVSLRRILESGTSLFVALDDKTIVGVVVMSRALTLLTQEYKIHEALVNDLYAGHMVKSKLLNMAADAQSR